MAKKQKGTFQIGPKIHISKNQHHELVELLKKKLKDQKHFHDTRVHHFAAIDRAIYGYLILDEEDQKRHEDTKKGYGIKPTDTSLPLALVQLDEAVTFFIEVLSADSGLYGAIAPKEKQEIATAFAAVMNENSDKFMHERFLSKALFDAMKYNFSALSTSWKTLVGNKLENSITGQPTVKEDEEVYSGNEMVDLDPYNFFYDLSVDPISLAQKGEFFAVAEIVSPFRAQKMLEDEEIFNVKEIIDSNTYKLTWYSERPKIRTDIDSSGASSSWLHTLGGVGSSTSTDKAMEFVTFNIWLPVKKFGIGTSEKMQICRVTLVNNEVIAKVEILNNSHGNLPVGIIMPIDDGFSEATKSYGELLMPFQQFASFQLNIHQKANRKALYGLTFYNKNVINLDDEYDPLASKVSVNAPPEADLRKSIFQIYDAPNTANTMRDIEAVNGLMQKILPTEILKQVAGLERATQYQAAATVQGANRRNLKLAKIINAQAFAPIKRMQMQNILQYQTSMELLTPEGDLIEVNPAKFRDTKIEFSISDGLKGLDKMSITMAIKEVLNTIVQSQQASQQFDVVAIIDYWTSLLGDKTDFSQFEFKSEIDKLPPEQKDLAFQLLQQFMEQQQGSGGGQAAGAPPQTSLPA